MTRLPRLVRPVAVLLAILLPCPLPALARSAEGVVVANQVTPAEAAAALGVGAFVNISIRQATPAEETEFRGVLQAIGRDSIVVASGPGSTFEMPYHRIRDLREASVAGAGRMPWADVSKRLNSRYRAGFTLPSGVTIEGAIVRMVPDGFVINVAKTSDATVQPKGLLTLPQESISVL